MAIVVTLYVISLSNYVLFHTLVELFSVYVAYVIFLIVWKSKVSLENRFLILLGIAYFFIGSLDLIYALTFQKMEIFSGVNSNMHIQLWIAARYMESISFLLASLFLKDYEFGDIKWSNKIKVKIDFAWNVFIGYAGVTIICLLSIFVFRNFPDCYIEGSGVTFFKILSEYLISFILICALIALYTKRNNFENYVFKLLAASIVLTILGELSLTFYSHSQAFSDTIGHIFKILSFYLVYKAIIETGFEDPFSLLFRELKQSEECLRQEAIFLKDDQGHIYKMLGMSVDETENETAPHMLQTTEKNYLSFLQNIHGLIVFVLDENFSLVFMHGDVEEITGYTKEDFLSENVKWTEIIVPENQSIEEKRKKTILNPSISAEFEYQIQRKDGEIKWVREVLQKIPESSGTSGKVQGFIRDITKRKIAEDTLAKIQEARIKEIHHRIKNNLQIISSLLSLEAEKFTDQRTLEAFRESQNRVISMALIHEELYEGKGTETIDFAVYLQKLTADLFSSYNLRNEDINLNLDIKQIYLGMDTAIPLGIIVNELISNSLKHAFPNLREGKINITLQNKENLTDLGSRCKENNNFPYVLTVSDNGKGIPEEIDFRNTDSLGLQLVNLLIEQIDGYIELEMNHGTKFTIWFRNIEN